MLELAALAYAVYLVMERPEKRRTEQAPLAAREKAPQERQPRAVHDDAPEADLAFLTESADEATRYYRAGDGAIDVIAAFYADGRLRLADAQHRFAGMLQGNHADVLELGTNKWIEVFVRVTPTGRMQLELRGGAYDTHVLTCASLDKLETSKLTVRE